jgi:hypothetical protein
VPKTAIAHHADDPFAEHGRQRRRAGEAHAIAENAVAEAERRSDAAVILFEPRQTYRFTRGGQALLNFSLKNATKDPAELEILNSEGKTIRKLGTKGRAGMNRVKWDLRYEAPRLVALRTLAPDNPHIWEEPRFRDSDSRPISHWGTKPAEVGPVVAPGKYTVRLKIDGQSYTQSLTVLRDPRSPGSDADIDLSVKTGLQICDDISHVSDTVNQIEWLRKQLEVIETMLRPPKKKEKEKPAFAEEDEDDNEEHPPAPSQSLDEDRVKQNADLLKAAENLDEKLQTVEHRFVSPALTNSDDKYYSESYKLYLNLIWLNAEVGTGGGDVAGGADFAPTDTQLELLKTFGSEMAGADADYQKIIKTDLPGFNRSLADKNLAPLVEPLNSKPSKPE